MRVRLRLVAICLPALLVAPLPSSLAGGGLRFTDVALQQGLVFVHPPTTPAASYVDIMGSGVCLFDYDGDSRLDVFFVQQQPPGPGWSNAHALAGVLYRNLGGRFADVTRDAGLTDAGHGMGCAHADYDNDGDQDLYVTRHGGNLLYRNSGDGTFSQVAGPMGVADARWSTSAAWLDLERDGDLDLLVANYVHYDPLKEAGKPFGPSTFPGVGNTVYRNDGRVFKDVSELAQCVPRERSKTLGLAVADVDGDGDADWLAANDGEPNALMINERSRCVDRAARLGLADPRAGMGAKWGDLDGDLDPDLVVTNFAGEGHLLARNLGGRFRDDALEAGLQASFDYVAWGIALEDFDRDGRLDIAVATGHVMVLGDKPDGPTFLYRNVGANGELKFADETGAAGDTATQRMSRGLASGDLDNDGDVDLVVANTNGQLAQFLRNDSPGGHWLGLALKGTRSNADALGAKVFVTTAHGTHVREVTSGGSYLSDGDHRVLVGLGAETEASLRIVWPSGLVEEHRGVPVDRYLLLTEGAGIRAA